MLGSPELLKRRRNLGRRAERSGEERRGEERRGEERRGGEGRGGRRDEARSRARSREDTWDTY